MPRSATMIVANPFVMDTRVLKEATTLLGRGWSVTVVCSADPGLPARETRDGIRVVRVPHEPLPSRAAKALMRRRAAASGAAAPATFVPSADVSGPELHARRALEALTHARFWRRAALAAARTDPALVVAHDLDALPAGAAAAAMRRVPLVYDAHELWVEMPPLLPRSRAGRAAWMTLERLLARRAALTITVSDGIAGELARRYGIRRPLVVRNVPPRSGQRPPPPGGGLRARLGLDAATPVVLYLGGASRGRGLEELVEAMGRVPEATLATVGPVEPGFAATLEAGAGAAGARLRMLPAVPAAEVGGLAAEADVGVVPYRDLSLNHRLALPTKLFDYLGAGVPIVSGDLPEIRAVVHAHRAGVTCDTGDPAAVAAAVREAIGRRDELRANARRAGDVLTWEREGDRYADALDALVAR